ncbi:MAG: hypothetical protein AAGJ35_05210 [Myxococcota bacterium]
MKPISTDMVDVLRRIDPQLTLDSKQHTIDVEATQTMHKAEAYNQLEKAEALFNKADLRERQQQQSWGPLKSGPAALCSLNRLRARSCVNNAIHHMYVLQNYPKLSEKEWKSETALQQLRSVCSQAELFVALFENQGADVHPRESVVGCRNRLHELKGTNPERIKQVDEAFAMMNELSSLNQRLQNESEQHPKEESLE